jgi:hypothetical protein
VVPTVENREGRGKIMMYQYRSLKSDKSRENSAHDTELGYSVYGAC